MPASKRWTKFGRAGVAAFSGRILTIMAGTATTLVLPVVLHASEVGTYFLIHTWIAGLAVFVQFGLTMSVPSIVSAALAVGNSGRARQAVRQTLAICALIGIATGATVWTGLRLLPVAETQGTSAIVIQLAPQIAVMIPLVALAAVFAEELRAMHAITPASILGAGPTVFVAIYVVLAHLARQDLTLALVLDAGIVGATASVLFGGIWLHRATRDWTVDPGPSIGLMTIIRHALPNVVTTLTLFVVSQTDLWIIAAFLTSTDVAHYGLATRLAGLLLIPLAVVNAVITPVIVGLWARRRAEDLQTLLSKTAIAAAAAAAIFYLGFLLIGRGFIVQIWGNVYEPLYFLFIIVGFGQVVHTAAGSSGVVLILLGRQVDAMRLTILFGFASIAAAVVAVNIYGSVGVAIAFAGGNILQTLAFARAVQRNFHLNPFASLRFLRNRAKQRRASSLARRELL